ncbi:MAG: hexulose-6-phosphate isomerase, partial [Treponema sp.]|nr:hexulose-6-phosphate isomerase [Treponema sp.]
MNTKNKKTIENIYKRPIPNNILWADIENLFVALGAEISKGAGSRIRVK